MGFNPFFVFERVTLSIKAKSFWERAFQSLIRTLALSAPPRDIPVGFPGAYKTGLEP
jgi:hypothetical protein